MCGAVMSVTGPDGCVPQVGDNDDGRLIILSGYPDWPRHDHRYLLGLGATLFGRGDLKAAAGEWPGRGILAAGHRRCRRIRAHRAGALGPARPCPCRCRPLRDPQRRRRGLRSDPRGAAAPPSAPAGHAHNDALSLELWTGGRPVFVDPGTICYTSDLAVRDRLRATASHNTVMVDGQEINRLPARRALRDRSGLLGASAGMAYRNRDRACGRARRLPAPAGACEPSTYDPIPIRLPTLGDRGPAAGGKARTRRPGSGMFRPVRRYGWTARRREWGPRAWSGRRTAHSQPACGPRGTAPAMGASRTRRFSFCLPRGMERCGCGRS